MTEMSTETDHDHNAYAVSSGIICEDCGNSGDVCAFCNHTWHDCKSPKVENVRIMRGYRVIPDFPEYMVNKQATVRHITTHKFCILVRVSKEGGAMVNVRKNGKPYTRAAQDLRDMAFGDAS